MPPRTAQAVPMLLFLLLVSARAAEPEGEEQREREEGVDDPDPEVTACRQQCARQWQFGAPERRYCLRQCDEYGRAKRREEGPERERDRCLHECRAGPTKPGCERRCREAYERATRGRGDAGPRDLASVPARGVRGGKLEAAVV